MESVCPYEADKHGKYGTLGHLGMCISTGWLPGWPLSIWLLKRFTACKNDFFLFALYSSTMGKGYGKMDGEEKLPERGQHYVIFIRCKGGGGGECWKWHCEIV
jgi:hypothetical protein